MQPRNSIEAREKAEAAGLNQHDQASEVASKLPKGFLLIVGWLYGRSWILDLVGSIVDVGFIFGDSCWASISRVNHDQVSSIMINYR